MDEISREDALQAAMLAKLVSTNLSQIDRFSDSANIRANRIDMNQFIAPVMNKTNQIQGGALPTAHHHFSSPPAEDIIRQMIPEPPPKIIPQAQEYTNAQGNNTAPVIQNTSKIEEYLKNINDNLTKLVSFIKNE